MYNRWSASLTLQVCLLDLGLLAGPWVAGVEVLRNPGKGARAREQSGVSLALNPGHRLCYGTPSRNETRRTDTKLLLGEPAVPLALGAPANVLEQVYLQSLVRTV